MMAEVGCTVPYLPNVDGKICTTKVIQKIPMYQNSNSSVLYTQNMYSVHR